MNSKLVSTLRIASLAAVAAFGLFDATSAQAGTDTSNLAVSATVANSCTIGTTPLAFGAYDGVGANATADLDVASQVTVTCTLAGADVTVTLGQGLHDVSGTAAAPVRRMSNGLASPSFMTYTIFRETGRSTNWGNTLGSGVATTPTGSAVNVPIFGRVDQGQSLVAGTYTDTVVATVTF